MRKRRPIRTMVEHIDARPAAAGQQGSLLMRRVVRTLHVTALVLLIAAPLLLAAVPVYASDPPTRYVVFDTGDTDSNDISGSNWTAMQFTVGDTSHTVSSVRLSLQRSGVPGYLYTSIRHAGAGGLPVGYDLAVSSSVASLTLPIGSYTFIEFLFPSPITLEAGESYAVLLYAPDGDAANYALWEGNSAGGLANAVGCSSENNGVSWTTDSPTDYLIEIWGYPVMDIFGAAVFSDFLETGDLLFTINYYNDFEPYSPHEFAAQYFLFQLIDRDDVTVLAQNNMRAWGYRPGSIYLSAGMAGPLEWGGNYTIRMYGTFGSNPYETYTLIPSDWKGTELLLLDHWVLTTASFLEDELGVTLVTDVAGSSVLDDRGHAMFVLGIPHLSVVRPRLFEVSSESVVPDDETHVPMVTDPDTELGTDVIDWLDQARVFVGVDTPAEMGVVFTAVGAAAIIGLLALFGHLLIGIAMAYVGLLVTTLVGITDWPLLGVVTFAGAVVWVFHHFGSK